MMRMPPDNHSQEAIRAFFREHRANQPDPLVFDGALDGYCQQIIPILPASAANQYLDLGCGDAGLYEFLRRRSIPFRNYIGVDFAVGSAVACGRSDFQIIDARIQDKALEKLVLPGTHLVFINSICYQENLDEIPVLSHAARHCGNSLIVLEPFPGLFWDKHFSGVQPRYRAPFDLIVQLESMGWRPQKEAVFYLFKMGSTWVWPLTYGVSFQSAKHDFKTNQIGESYVPT